VDPKTVTELMGHSSIITSRGYQHLSKQRALAALVGIAGTLELGPAGVTDGAARPAPSVE
jgi:hypothetical protein